MAEVCNRLHDSRSPSYHALHCSWSDLLPPSSSSNSPEFWAESHLHNRSNCVMVFSRFREENLEYTQSGLQTPAPQSSNNYVLTRRGLLQPTAARIRKKRRSPRLWFPGLKDFSVAVSACVHARTREREKERQRAQRARQRQLTWPMPVCPRSAVQVHILTYTTHISL